MKHKTFCEHCGHQVVAYAHKLNRGLVNAFCQLAEFWLDNSRDCNINKELRLTHNQIANFQKLRHFGIVLNIEDGSWIPTCQGLQFYFGNLSIWDTAGSFGNKTMSYDDPAWKTHKRVIKKVYLSDVSEPNYKSREEYKEEKRETLFDMATTN